MTVKGFLSVEQMMQLALFLLEFKKLKLTLMSSSLYSRRLPSGSSKPAHSSSPPTSPPWPSIMISKNTIFSEKRLKLLSKQIS